MHDVCKSSGRIVHDCPLSSSCMWCVPAGSSCKIHVSNCSSILRVFCCREQQKRDAHAQHPIGQFLVVTSCAWLAADMTSRSISSHGSSVSGEETQTIHDKSISGGPLGGELPLLIASCSNVGCNLPAIKLSARLSGY